MYVPSVDDGFFWRSVVIGVIAGTNRSGGLNCPGCGSGRRLDIKSTRGCYERFAVDLQPSQTAAIRSNGQPVGSRLFSFFFQLHSRPSVPVPVGVSTALQASTQAPLRRNCHDPTHKGWEHGVW